MTQLTELNLVSVGAWGGGLGGIVYGESGIGRECGVDQTGRWSQGGGAGTGRGGDGGRRGGRGGRGDGRG
eukprot:648361-Rhodomonas_salina.1